jgi:SAM-dependent methyltransferase
MNLQLLDHLACPKCGACLRLVRPATLPALDTDIEEGLLECTGCQASHPILRSMPRFVPSEMYAASFGFQWNKFPTLQVDSVMKNNLSRTRFFATTGWPERLDGQRVLEAGCGSGRFTQLVLDAGAEVFSFDLSSAVEAAYGNNQSAPNLHVFQASIFEIPLRKAMFDKIFCMGVIQHCPDPRKAFLSLVPFLRPGGEIVIDVYAKTGFPPPLKYWVRPLTRRMSPEALYRTLEATIPLAFELKKWIYRLPGVGTSVARLIPIGPLSHVAIGLNYTEEELKQVKILSAFDMLSPRYDLPQEIGQVRDWFGEAGLIEAEIWLGYNGINAKGKKSCCS